MNAYEIFDGAYENAKMNGIEAVDAQYFSDYAENAMNVILPRWIAEKMVAVYSELMACDDKRDNNFWHIVEKPLTEIENNCPGSEMIKAARKSAGLTQEQAARVIGATRRAWQEWEAGRRNMPGAKWELFQRKVQAGEVGAASGAYQWHRSWNAWNVSLWINNDEGLYRWAYDLARRHGVKKAARIMADELEGQRTPDGARYNVTCIREAIADILS